MENFPVRRLPRAGSTNDELRAAALAEPESWPHGSALMADHQFAGKGRAGRVWETPPGVALTVSILLRPAVPVADWTWLPLLTGLAVQRALTPFVPEAELAVKWPNDLLAVDVAEEIDGFGGDRKLGGILVEGLLPERAAIVGVGLNLGQRSSELPVPSATSLAILGAADPDRDVILAAVRSELLAVTARWEVAGGAAALREEISAVCRTLGMRVRLERPAGEDVVGTASRLDEIGRLVIDSGGTEIVIDAGNVRHLRRW